MVQQLPFGSALIQILVRAFLEQGMIWPSRHNPSVPFGELQPVLQPYFLNEGASLTYVFDFGDWWEFTIQLEQIDTDDRRDDYGAITESLDSPAPWTNFLMHSWGDYLPDHLRKLNPNKHTTSTPLSATVNGKFLISSIGYYLNGLPSLI